MLIYAGFSIRRGLFEMSLISKVNCFLGSYVRGSYIRSGLFLGGVIYLEGFTFEGLIF